MSLFKKLSFLYLRDPIYPVLDLIKSWTPEECKTEKDYERSLVAYLKEKIPEGIKVVTQSGIERMRVDIVVADRVAVELKHNMNSTDKMQRLIGQLQGYRKHFGEILIVLCGNHQKDLVDQIKKEAGNLGGMVEVIEK